MTNDIILYKLLNLLFYSDISIFLFFLFSLFFFYFSFQYIFVLPSVCIIYTFPQLLPT